MRYKGRKGRIKKILIRVTAQEKKNIDTLAKLEGKNTSEFIRSLVDKKLLLHAAGLEVIAAVELNAQKIINALKK